MKRILIIDSGPGLAKIVATVQGFGYRAVLLSENEARDRHGADEVVLGECIDSSQIVRAINECRIDGIFPPLGPCSAPAALAAKRCNLAMLGAAAAGLTQYRHTEAVLLRTRSVSSISLHVAETALEAQEASREFGMPVWIGAVETYSESAIHEVEHLEDLSLAYARVTRRSLLTTAVVTRPLRGRAFYVDGVVIDGVFSLSGIIERDIGEAPFLFDRVLFVPPALSSTERDALAAVAARALDALDCRNGCVHIGIVLTDDGPVVMDVFGAPAALRFPGDLLLLAHGTDTLGNAVRFALGEAPEFGAGEGSAALCWIPTHSGVVTEIWGVEEARAIPGILEVVVGVGPGDAMRHVVDCESRDRVGYVLAAGDDARAAVRRALAAIEIVTKPSY